MSAAAGSWQDMNSAPRDGTHVLLFLPESAYVPILVGEWQEDASCPDGGAWWEVAAEPPPYPIDVEASKWAQLFAPVNA